MDSSESALGAEFFCYIKFGDYATNLPSTVRFASNGVFKESMQYRYDSMGNIIAVFENGRSACGYEYDALGRLTREDNVAFAKNTIWAYDNNGNIIAKYEYALTTKPTILPANIRNIPCLTIKLNRIQFCCNFMWTIAFVCGIIFHEVIESFLLGLSCGDFILTELNHFFYSFFVFGLTSIVTLQSFKNKFFKILDFKNKICYNILVNHFCIEHPFLGMQLFFVHKDLL